MKDALKLIFMVAIFIFLVQAIFSSSTPSTSPKPSQLGPSTEDLQSCIDSGLHCGKVNDALNDVAKEANN